MINVAELDERIERCLAILADNPQSQVFAALAEAYRRRGEFGRAFAVCKSGIKHHPDYSPAHIVMAKLYLHQKMLPDAERSLQRAIDLEGQTRITDMLAAELYLEMGDLPHAKAAVNRLRLMDPSNQAVDELSVKLRQRGIASREQSAKREDARAADTPESDLGGSMHQARSVPTDPVAPVTLTWDQWSNAVGEIPGVMGAFAFDPTDRMMAASSHPQVGKESFEGMLSMFRTIDAELRSSGFGALEEIRIETERQELWSSTLTGFVIGLLGSHSLSYGSARRSALDLADDVRLVDETGESQSPPVKHLAAIADHHDAKSSDAMRRDADRDRERGRDDAV